jgi:hypothetical protein
MVYEVESVIEALRRDADTSMGPDVRRFPMDNQLIAAVGPRTP